LKQEVLGEKYIQSALPFLLVLASSPKNWALNTSEARLNSTLLAQISSAKIQQVISR
jgi:hypothetical protein